MPKKLIVATAILSLFLMVGVAKAKTMGDPLQEVWDAIELLQKQFINIESTPGPEGPQGPQGEVGPMGPQGPAGTGLSVSGLYSVVEFGDVDPNTTRTFNPTCRPGDLLLSGGYTMGTVPSEGGKSLVVSESRPVFPDTWRIKFTNLHPLLPYFVNAVAWCNDITPQNN